MTGRLAIDRFQVVGLAPGDHPDPGRLKHAIERIDQQRLVRSISAALDDFGANDERFVVLRRLDITSIETMIGDADLLAGQLAEGVRTALTRLAGMGSSETIVVFPSPADRLSAFVKAAARGEAWGKWWFFDLDHLKLLPISSAIRVALSQAAAIGLEALGKLTDADREAVLDMLSAVDAEYLLDDIAATLADEESEDVWVQAFALPLPARPWPTNKVVLEQLAILASRAEAPLPRTVLTALAASTELRRNSDHRSLATALGRGSIGKISTMVANLQPSTLAAITALRASTRALMRDAMLQSISVERSQPAFTRFGGILLLWPHLPPAVRDSVAEGSAGLLGLLALSALFGADEAAAALNDPVLRKLFSLDAGATLDEFAQSLERIDPRSLPRPTRRLQGSKLPAEFSGCPEQNRRVREVGLVALEDFARRLPGLAKASLPFLIRNILGIGARLITNDSGCRANLDRPPLDVLLSIAGLADRMVALPTGQLLELARSP